MKGRTKEGESSIAKFANNGKKRSAVANLMTITRYPPGIAYYPQNAESLVRSQLGAAVACDNNA
jgi:hypothetical protein